MGFLSKLADPLGITKKAKKKIDKKLGFDPDDPFGLEKKTEEKIKDALGYDFEKYNFKSMWKQLKKNPGRALIGSFDPASTKMWNKVLGKDYEPIINQMGGATSKRFQDYLDQGGDPRAASNAATAHQAAAAIASWYAGGALAAAAPGAAAGAGAGAGGAGAIAPAGAGGLGMSAAQAAQLARAGVTAGAGAADAEFDPIDLEQQYAVPGSLTIGNVPGFKEGGYASPAQARLMRAVAHGWKKPGGGGPSRAVANEFVDKKDRGMAMGGDVISSLRQQQDAMDAVGYQEGGWVAPKGWRYGTAPISMGDAINLSGKGGMASMVAPYFQLKEAGWTGVPDSSGDGKKTMWYPPEQTLTGTGGVGGDSYTPPVVDPNDPFAHRYQNDSDFSEGSYNAIPEMRGPRGGRGGRGGGGRGRPPYEPPPPRIIPGNPPVTPPGRDDDGGLVGGSPPAYVAPSAGRESTYSQELAAHKARIKDILGSARGGSVGYAEGGKVRPGHAEGPNPYKEGTARYRLWERHNHKDPEVKPPPSADVEEIPSWLDRIFAPAADLSDKSERELESIGEARGGRVGYAVGGLAAMGGRRPPGPVQPWRGAPPPRVQPGRGMPPGGPRGPGIPPGRHGIPPGMDPRRSGPKLGPPAGYDPRGGPISPQPGEGTGLPGGPQIPANLRGQMQKMRMMNRPRRGVPGPAGAGGPPGGGNRVGMQDQQGGLARALQRGTGRPPTSRRSGFPGR